MFLRKTHSGIGLFAILLIAVFMAGCSENKAPVNTTPVGSLTDPQFVPVKNQINNFLDSTTSYFSAGFDNVYGLPTDTGQVRNQYGPMGVNDTAIYLYANGWHFIYVSRSNTYFVHHLADSVQFMLNNEAIEHPAGLDYLHYIRHWDFTVNGTEATHTNMAGHLDLQFAGLNTDVAAINGTKNLLVEWAYVGTDTTIDAIYDMDVAVSDVHINKVGAVEEWASGCPSSGSFNIDITQSLTVTDISGKDLFVRNWTATVEFINGTANVTVNGMGKVWTYSLDLCTVAGS